MAVCTGYPNGGAKSSVADAAGNRTVDHDCHINGVRGWDLYLAAGCVVILGDLRSRIGAGLNGAFSNLGLRARQIDTENDE